MFTLRDALRWLQGGDAKKKPGFATEKEAYDFCRNLYKKSGGVTPELRKSFEFYTKHLNDECREFVGPVDTPHPASSGKRMPQQV